MITKILFLLTCRIFFIACSSLICLCIKAVVQRYRIKKWAKALEEILQNISANEANSH